jgi:hypothetical protein
MKTQKRRYNLECVALKIKTYFNSYVKYKICEKMRKFA